MHLLLVHVLLQSNIGPFSTGIGAYALQANTTATTNVGCGFEAGYSITTNNHGSYFGFRSGKFLTGAGNTLIGSECCSIGVGSGGENTIVGQFGNRNGFGSQNCFLGAGCGPSLTSGSQHIAIGYYQNWAQEIS